MFPKQIVYGDASSGYEYRTLGCSGLSSSGELKDASGLAVPWSCVVAVVLGNGQRVSGADYRATLPL